MLQPAELKAYFDERGVPEATRALINVIRHSDPVRRTDSSPRSSAARYPSKKMGFSIQAESHTVELVAVTLWEHDPKVFEYYDQSQALTIYLPDKNGALRSRNIFPDYFLINTDYLGWVECKTTDELEALVNKGDHRFVKQADGRWTSPAAEEAARKLGLQYSVWTRQDVSDVFVANVRYLSDYSSTGVESIDRSVLMTINDLLQETPCLRLSDIFEHFKNDPNDIANIYTLIAHGAIYVDLHRDGLARPSFVKVFRDKPTAEAWHVLNGSEAKGRLNPQSRICLNVGAKFEFEETIWEVLGVSHGSITCRTKSGECRTIPIETLQDAERALLAKAVADGLNRSMERAKEILQQASSADASDALRRLKWIEYTEKVRAGEEDAEKPEGNEPSPRTLEKWRAQAARGERNLGNALAALITIRAKKGNRTPRLSPSVQAIVTQVLEDWSKDKDNKNLFVRWGQVREQCAAICQTPPSYKTFTRWSKKWDQFKVKRAQEGARAAYDKEPWLVINQHTPRHGERPFEIGHIDHTQVDIQLRSVDPGGPTRKPWLTVLLDAYSRYVLAWVLSYNSPSAESCRAVLIQCIKNHNRLPDRVVTDSGAEFESIYYETLLARLGVVKVTRALGKPRAGSLIERWFGRANENFIHTLCGNNTPLQKPRSMSSTHDPRTRTNWDLGTFQDSLGKFIDNTYHQMLHHALDASPAEAFAAGCAQSGTRLGRYIPWDAFTDIVCMPSTRKGTAKVVASRGVCINSLYYSSRELLAPKFANKQVEVRYDPMDSSTAFAYLDGRWVTLRSQYAAEFKNHSVKEVAILSAELRARNRNAGKRAEINAEILARALRKPNPNSSSLIQRQKDEQFRAANKPVLPAHLREVTREEKSAHAEKQPAKRGRPRKTSLPPEVMVSVDPSMVYGVFK